VMLCLKRFTVFLGCGIMGTQGDAVEH